MEIGLEAAPKTSKAQLFGRLLLGLMLFTLVCRTSPICDSRFRRKCRRGFR